MKLPAPLAALRARLAGRQDTEHEQAIIRLLNCAVLFLYLRGGPPGIWAAYVGVCMAVLAHIVLQPAVSPTRRTLAALNDIGFLTWILVYFGEQGAPLYFMYIWITLANGFRFGPGALAAVLGFSVVGFGIALAYGEFWLEHRQLGLVLLFGLVAVSLYVKKLVTKLFDAIERAEAANVAKRRFISVVSHELRTPLNAIIGMADLLRDTPLSREQADMLQTLRSSSRVMLGLVEDVLDFSKIEAGRLNLDRVDFDLYALVNSTCRILAAQAAEKGVEFVVSIMPEVPPAVRGDPHYLRQILINLAGNAVKFTQRGSVTVHVSAQSESEGHVRLKFSVRDTGIGIAPEAQARIFESFAQADQSTTRRFGGTGLGTTIAKQLVELMGGRIGLESAAGLGSTFWFEVPFEARHEPVARGELAGARVLLVGFPTTDAEAMTAALGGWGAVPVFVPDLQAGLNRLVAEISVAQPYQSVLLYSAEGDAEAARRFRRAAPDPAPPLVLAIPSGAPVKRFAALSAGFAAVLELPFDKRLLFNVLHSVRAGDEVREGVVRLKDYAQRSGGGRPLQILVADDNPTNREVIGKILERAGHAVTLVDDGERALDALELRAFDLAILDRNMPGTGGIEALPALRVMTRGRARLPVIILSADATPEARREALQAGADAFLAKPIQAARLLDEIGVLTRAAAQELRADAGVAPAAALAPTVAVVNAETLGHLEALGSTPQFIEKLVGVFLDDSRALLGRAERTLGARGYAEFRSIVHAVKGSSASMGTDRLTRLCESLGALSDAELRLQSARLLASLSDEIAAAGAELQRYVGERRKSAS